MMHPIDDQAGERHLIAFESLDEVGRFAQGVGLGGGDDDERGAGSL